MWGAEGQIKKDKIIVEEGPDKGYVQSISVWTWWMGERKSNGKLSTSRDERFRGSEDNTKQISCEKSNSEGSNDESALEMVCQRWLADFMIMNLNIWRNCAVNIHLGMLTYKCYLKA